MTVEIPGWPLKDSKVLIVGTANEHSIAHGRARAFQMDGRKALPDFRRLDVFKETVMTKKMVLRNVMLAACMVLAVMSGSARAEEIPLVTGVHWSKASEDQKKVYLVGVANFVQIEIAYQAATPPSAAQSIVSRIATGLKGQTLDSVREGLNRWYTAHPDRLQRPVIETIWFEMVVPGLQKTK